MDSLPLHHLGSPGWINEWRIWSKSAAFTPGPKSELIIDSRGPYSHLVITFFIYFNSFCFRDSVSKLTKVFNKLLYKVEIQNGYLNLWKDYKWVRFICISKIFVAKCTCDQLSKCVFLENNKNEAISLVGWNLLVEHLITVWNPKILPKGIIKSKSLWLPKENK